MKKLFIFLAMALTFAACQQDGAFDAKNSDLVDVVLTVDTPELGVTRGLDGDTKTGYNSALGAIDFLTEADWANYDLRYILEVYDANDDGTGEPIYRERLVNCLDKYAPTTFALRLVPNREYKFVVFADFVAEGNAELTEPADKLAIRDLYYNTADLRNITTITSEPTWNAMNELRDAYFVTENVHITQALNKTIILTRPFAKLRVIATDLDYIKGYAKPGHVVVKYHTEKVYKSFNAVSGKLNAEEMTGDELVHSFDVAKHTPYTAGYDAAATNQTIFADYLLAVEGEQTAVNFEIEVFESKGGRSIHKHDFTTQIPIQRNYLTTIIGDLLTTQANITVEVNDNFLDEWIIGAGDGNSTTINNWGPGKVAANGNYEFELTVDSVPFLVSVNSAAVKNNTLSVGTYVLAEDQTDKTPLTFTVTNLKANESTRAMEDVKVIGGRMVVEKLNNTYGITLDLVIEFVPQVDVRHAYYKYEGEVEFSNTKLVAPAVTAVVDGNTATLTWDAVEGAGSYSISVGTEMPVITEETSYTFTGEYETEYTFTVVAIPTDENAYDASEATTVTITTEAEPIVAKPLATPVVEAAVEGNVVTLTWEAIENAAQYGITVGTEMPVFVEETTYTFTGEYETEYTFNVVAVPEDEVYYTVSEAATVTATTEAEATVEPEPSAKTVTVAEFLTMPEDESEGAAKYRLTGVITRMYRENNSNDTLYGNFYLKDTTGEVLIYGLMDKDGNKYWETSGAKIGDTITVETVRTSYNGSPQGKNSTFIELVPFVATASEWGVVGDLTNWAAGSDIVMYNTWKAENLFVAYDVEFTSGAFKIRANNEWNDAKNYGLSAAGKIYADKYYTLTNGAGSQNITPMVYGTYDVYFDLTNERVALVTPGKEYTDAENGGDPVVVIEGLTDHEWGLVGSFNGWDVANYVVTEVVGDWAVAKNVALTNGAEFKFAADKAWTLSYGSACNVNVGETYTTYENGQNMIFVGEDGAYNLYFSLVDAKFYMETYSAATTVTFNVADYNFANQTALDSYTVGDVTIAFDGGGNSNSPKYYTSGTAVRCYPKNTITVSGKTIKKVEVVAPDGYTNAIDLYNDSTKLDNFTWEGSSENVVLTFDPNKSSGQSRFVKINVTYE